MLEQLNFFIFRGEGKRGILLPCFIGHCQGDVEDELQSKEVPCHLKRCRALFFGGSRHVCGLSLVFQWLSLLKQLLFFIFSPFPVPKRPQATESVSYLRLI